MKNQKPKKIIEYGSAIRSNFNNILKFTKPYFDNFKNENFIIKHMKKVDDELLKSVQVHLMLYLKIIGDFMNFHLMILKDFLNHPLTRNLKFHFIHFIIMNN